MPPLLLKYLSTEAFGVWILILQLSAYSNYLDFGIQTAVGRFVAYANEMGDKKGRDSIINTAIFFLTCSCLAAVGGVVFASLQLNHLFPQIPAQFKIQAQISLTLVGVSTAIGLPLSVFIGVFIGYQRYDIPAFVIGGGKLLSGIIVILVAREYKALVPMAIAFSLINFLIYFFEYFAYLKLKTKTFLSLKLVSKEKGKELFDYCFSLSVWSLAMLLVTGLDTTLVAWLDFRSLVYYGIAANLIVFISGLQSAIFNVLIPSAAVLIAQGKNEKLGKLLVVTTRYGMILLIITGLFLITFGDSLTSIWLGAKYSVNLIPILQVLVLANIIRLSAVPYATILIGTGQQRLIILSPLLEGATNLISSIILGKLFGAIGVALGTLIGSVFGILGNYLYNMKLTSKVIKFSFEEYFMTGMLKPALCSIPIIILLAIKFNHPGLDGILLGSLQAVTCLSALIVIWVIGLTNNDREKMMTFAKIYMQRR